MTDGQPPLPSQHRLKHGIPVGLEDLCRVCRTEVNLREVENECISKNTREDVDLLRTIGQASMKMLVVCEAPRQKAILKLAVLDSDRVGFDEQAPITVAVVDCVLRRVLVYEHIEADLGLLGCGAELLKEPSSPACPVPLRLPEFVGKIA
ncbi:hypothetical protein [Sorangium cellulosum]|uniref:hypothetical protein n=1 Tax=Sorangium cellulosum TaxID=56 RepID=UPI0011DCBCF7|nr:hypothetical protein [Sorangium cellulosum]